MKRLTCKGCKYRSLYYRDVLLYWTPPYFCKLKGRKIDENDAECEEYTDDEELQSDISDDGQEEACNMGVSEDQQ